MFADPDGDALTIEAESGDSSVVAVAVSGFTLTLAASGTGGETRVTLTARDPDGLEASMGFVVAVNRAPEMTAGIPAQTVVAEGPVLAVDLSGHFTDPDGDPLTFEASSGDTSVVAVAVSAAVLTVWAVAVREAEAEVTVTASDPHSMAFSASFGVVVVDNPDRAALEALYDATDGPNWKDNDDWLTGAPLSEWYGVSVNEDGRVISLHLSSNDLTGPIPLELGNLSALKSLQLGGNLTGPIPPELGDLAALERLYLNNNALTGPIPPELGDLAALEWLHLSGNALTGSIPPELGDLAALESLGLHRNALTGPIPLELGNLAALESLGLDDNALTGPIPPELGNLAALELLGLNWNALTGPIPLELGNLAALEYLSLNRNALTGPIPPELGNLTALKSLHLDDNALTGPIPPELGNLAALERLSLNYNDLTGPIPPELGDLAALRYLGLDTGLCVPGTVELWRWVSEQLTWFDGTFCNEADRVALETLYSATGGPDWTRSDGWLGEGPVLAEWHGVTTDSLGRAASLTLPGNNLAGRLPGRLGALAGLKDLDVSDNPRLAGPLPLTLGRVSLDTLRFSGTGLCSLQEAREWLESIPVVEGTGETCAPLSDRDILVALYDATDGPNWVHNDNWLTEAPLSEWYGVHVDNGRVVWLGLDGNALTGPIPPELGNLTALEWLSLVNDLTGPIPPELGNLTALKWLGLAGNRLTGPIPPELGNLTALEYLNLNWNALTGPIPPELGNLAALESLQLWATDLTGPIPPELGNLAALESLQLWATAADGHARPSTSLPS